MLGTPEKGKGTRNIDCDMHGACLEFAAKKGWKDFDCGKCTYGQVQSNGPAPGTTEEGKALCADCLERETLGKSPYCASCLGIRGNRAKAEAKARAKDKPPEKPKKIKPTQSKPEPAKALSQGNMVLTIDFLKHPEVLTAIRKLAEEEMRPIEWQVIFMIKKQLDTGKQG